MFMNRAPASNSAIPGSFNPPAGMANMPPQFGVGGFFDQLLLATGNLNGEIPRWSWWPNLRDVYLRAFWKVEPILAGGIYAMMSKVGTIGFEFKGKRPYTKAYYQRLAGDCDGGYGLSNLFYKTALSLLTQDNGAFWYLHGAGRPERALRGRVQDIRFLDSAQCWRSFDPEYPVYYMNPFDGTYHRLHKTRVVALSSMTQTDEMGRNVGFSAVSRVLQAAQIMRDMRQYTHELVSGQPSRGLLVMEGVNGNQIRQAIEANTEDAESASFFRYRGIDVIAHMNRKISAELINLASVPSGWNELDSTQLYVNVVALALGTDPRDLWPGTVSGATKGDAEVSDKKAKTKGIGDLLRLMSWAMNWHVIGRDAGVEFSYDYVDIEELLQQSQIDKTRAETYSLSVTAGAMSPEEMRAMQINDGTLDPTVLSDLAAVAKYDELSPVIDENGAVDESGQGVPIRAPFLEDPNAEDEEDS